MDKGVNQQFYFHMLFLNSYFKHLQTAKLMKWETPQLNMFFKDVVSVFCLFQLSLTQVQHDYCTVQVK